MTLKKRPKQMQIDVFPDNMDRDEMARIFDEARKAHVFDTDDKRLPGNPPGIKGSKDPMMFIRMDNMFKRFAEIFRSGSISSTIELVPVEISKATQGAEVKSYNSKFRRYWNDLIGISSTPRDIRGREVGKKDWMTGDLNIVQIFDLSEMDNIRSGVPMEALRRKKRGKEALPEYGYTKIRGGMLGLGKTREINRALVVYVEDKDPEGLVRDFTAPINIDKGKYDALVRSHPALDLFKRGVSEKPKTRRAEQLLEMAVIRTLGATDGLRSARSIRKPVMVQMEDPDVSGDKMRRYWQFTIGGFTGAATAGGRLPAEEEAIRIPTV